MRAKGERKEKDDSVKGGDHLLKGDKRSEEEKTKPPGPEIRKVPARQAKVHRSKTEKPT